MKCYVDTYNMNVSAIKYFYVINFRKEFVCPACGCNYFEYRFSYDSPYRLCH